MEDDKLIGIDMWVNRHEAGGGPKKVLRRQDFQVASRSQVVWLNELNELMWPTELMKQTMPIRLMRQSMLSRPMKQTTPRQLMK